MKRLKIAFDAKRLFHNREGLGSYARTLIADLKSHFPEHDYYLCTSSISTDFCDPAFYNPGNYTILLPPKGMNASWWRAKGIVSSLREHEIDVYFGLSNELPWGIEKLSIRTVVTIHDMLYKTFPQQFTRIDRWIYAKKFSHAIRTADVVLATSNHTKTDILKYHEVDADKIRVAYQSVASAFRAVKSFSGLGEYYLMVGTINERKNQIALVKAFSLLAEHEKRPVIIVGRATKYKQKLVEQIKAHHLEPYFSFKENVETAQLIELYKNAVALVFPSKYEGFGIPVIEALHLGIPVIGVKNSSLPEVVSKYGIIIEYNIPELLAKAIKLMNQEEVRSNYLNGVEKHLDKFDSSTVSKAVLDALKG